MFDYFNILVIKFRANALHQMPLLWEERNAIHQISLLWEERGKFRAYYDSLPINSVFWAVIFSTFGAIGVRPYLLRDFLGSWGNFPVRKNIRFLWRAVPLCLFWAIWKERNRVIFEDITFAPNRLKLSFSSSLHSCAGSIPNVDLSVVIILLCILPMNTRS